MDDRSLATGSIASLATSFQGVQKEEEKVEKPKVLQILKSISHSRDHIL